MRSTSPLLLSGSSHPAFAQEVADRMGFSLCPRHLHTFPDHELSVEIEADLQGAHLVVFQSLAFHPNRYLVELLLLLDALRRSDVASVTAVIPYYAYARQDRLERSGVSVGAKMVADLLERGGVDRLLTLDLHTEQTTAFFNIPVHPLHSHSLLISYCDSLHLTPLVVLAPDKGAVKIASSYARQLGGTMGLIDKERLDGTSVQMHLLVGSVEAATVLLVDDMCVTGATLFQAANACKARGAKRIFAAVGHGLLVGETLTLLDESPIELLLTTNSVPMSDRVRMHPKVRVISAVPLFVDALSSILSR